MVCAIGFAIFIVLLVDPASMQYRLIRPIIGDSIDWRAAYLSGWNAVNCGRVLNREDPREASNCAMNAAFRIIYDFEGIDTIYADGLVRTPKGDLLMLRWGTGMGVGHLYLQQQFAVELCPKPFHVSLDEHGVANCGSRR